MKRLFGVRRAGAPCDLMDDAALTKECSDSAILSNSELPILSSPTVESGPLIDTCRLPRMMLTRSSASASLLALLKIVLVHLLAPLVTEETDPVGLEVLELELGTERTCAPCGCGNQSRSSCLLKPFICSMASFNASGRPFVLMEWM